MQIIVYEKPLEWKYIALKGFTMNVSNINYITKYFTPSFTTIKQFFMTLKNTKFKLLYCNEESYTSTFSTKI